jgi:hypothetical protein
MTLVLFNSFRAPYVARTGESANPSSTSGSNWTLVAKPELPAAVAHDGSLNVTLYTCPPGNSVVTQRHRGPTELDNATPGRAGDLTLDQPRPCTTGAPKSIHSQHMNESHETPELHRVSECASGCWPNAGMLVGGSVVLHPG